MRCNICNKILDNGEIKIDPITNRWAPCKTCKGVSNGASDELNKDLDPDIAELLILGEDAYGEE